MGRNMREFLEDSNAPYLDLGDDNTDVFICQIVHFRSMHYSVCKL